MFNQNNDEEKKLDWMYKGPNSTVNREDYLLGRPVDRTLEQINDEEKQKQQGLLPQPKNRVEHECIPPSIRDFNKLVQAEQVDLSTKLQEDPLVAIKKREEESRREFLQNPVQLKKLQKALKAQQAKKKKKKKKKLKHSSDSDSDLDKKLTEKLLGIKNKKISKEERNLDIILMHKFEALKNKLSEDDLQNILIGQVTSDDSSEDEEQKKKSRKRHESSDDSEDERRQKSRKNIVRKDKYGKQGRSQERYSIHENEERKKKSLKKHENSDDSEVEGRQKNRQNIGRKDEYMKRRRSQERYYNDDFKRRRDRDHKSPVRSKDKDHKSPVRSKDKDHKSPVRSKDRDHKSPVRRKERDRKSPVRSKDKTHKKDSYEDYKKTDRRPKKRSISPRRKSSSESETEVKTSHSKKYDSEDSDYSRNKKINYGLVTSDGKKIPLSKKHDKEDNPKPTKASEPAPPVQKNKAKRLTEEEKDKLREEMMRNALIRDKERAYNLKKHREKEEKERKEQNFDPEFIHKQLLLSADTSSVESRIKSNLNNIQRSRRDMDKNFSKR